MLFNGFYSVFCFEYFRIGQKLNQQHASLGARLLMWSGLSFTVSLGIRSLAVAAHADIESFYAPSWDQAIMIFGQFLAITLSNIAFLRIFLEIAERQKIAATHQLAVTSERAEAFRQNSVVLAQLLQEREEIIRQLAMFNKTAGMGALVASLAHELNQPLTAIQLNAELIDSALTSNNAEALTDDTIKGALNDLLQDNQRAATIIKTLRNMFGNGRKLASTFDMNALVNEVLLKVAQKTVHGSKVVAGAHDRVTGLAGIERVVEVDQSPIGRTPRSNPATYTGIFDDIRKLFSAVPESRMRGYEPGRFSFNVKGGRCEVCQGQGVRKIEMHFLPDIFVSCEACNGSRYAKETLDIRLKGKTIAEVLDMTIDDAVVFFEAHPRIHAMLMCVRDVGLGYMQLGQASTTLSGGEAQRIKLATELGNRSTGCALYVLDEPTTGLHFDDVRKLLEVLNRLADAGHTLIVIEHNLDVIKCADWIIDLGPEGGERGGQVLATGTPEKVAQNVASATGLYLRRMLGQAPVHVAKKPRAKAPVKKSSKRASTKSV